MQYRNLRKQAALLLALTCSAVVLAGCSNPFGGNAAQTGETQPKQTVYSPTVPENRIDESVPGSDINAALGENVVYDNKVSVTLNQVIEIDDVNKAKNRVLLAELTITNNSDAPIDCSTLTHFALAIDGQDELEPLRDVVAAIVARKYYTAIQSDLQNFNQQIAAGASISGYVYIGAPTKWDTMQLSYIPYKYYNNDRIIFDLKEADFVHYTNDLP